jgi:hypothetical protein
MVFSRNTRTCEVLELDATFIDDEPLNSWESPDQFIIDFI